MLNDAMEKSFKVLQMIWIFMLCSVMVYVVICNLLQGKLEIMNGDSAIPVELIRNILLGISVIELLGLKFLRSKLLSLKPGMTMENGAQKYMVTSIISFAICESVAIFGMVVFLLGDMINILYVFAGISILGLFYYKPSREEYEDIINIRS